jgi:hypothetical protein
MEGQHEQVPAYSMCIRTTFIAGPASQTQSGHSSESEINHLVMAITSAEATFWHYRFRQMARLPLGIMMITFLCPNMGVSVESWFADTEDTDEIYERVTCLACRQLHMLNLRTGKILGVRQSPIGGSDVAATDESTLS